MNRRTAVKLLAASPLLAASGFERQVTQVPFQLLPQGPEPIPPPREVRWSIPAEAVAAAQRDAVDVQQADQFALPFTRWIWVQRGDGDEWRAVNDVLNKVSRGSVPVISPLVGGILVRVDLRAYWPRVGDLKEVLELWESFAFDPMLALLITGDTIRLLTDVQRAAIKVLRRETEWVWRNNAWFDTGRKSLVQRPLLDVKDLVVERTNAPHLAGASYEKLQDATGSLAPVVSSGYFLTRAFSTITYRGDNGKGKETLYSLVWGGLYYELAGIRRAVAKGRTDLDQLLQDLGVGSDKETFRQVFERFRSDENAVLIQSQVTGKRRRIRWFPTLATRLTQAYSVCFVTEDLRNQDVDAAADPLRNLLKSDVFAYEVIFNAPNGHQKFALFGENGELLEKGADNVVSDHRIPSPITTELQSGISCYRCHGSDAGWQPFANDAKRVLGKTTIFGDVSRPDDAVTDTLDRLRGLNDGDPTLLLQRLRADYQRTLLLSTGAWPGAGLQTDLVQRSSAKVGEAWRRERWDLVDAAYALRTMGVVPLGDGTLQLRVLCPPDATKIVRNGFLKEDPLLVALKDGAKILWNDWAMLYSWVLTRVLQEQQKR